MKRIIYDFGSNNGDDIPYYLKKADQVVAVEANSALYRLIRQRFGDEIRSGRLKVVNCVLANHTEDKSVAFYIHKTNHVLSQFPRPDDRHIDEFREVYMPSRRASELVAKFGDPYYIKIDVELCDHAILEDLFASNIRPAFISAEAHSIEVFTSLVSVGGYRAFKIVDGESVVSKFKNHVINTPEGGMRYSFPYHSAGPFGDDIPGRWLNPEELFYALASARLGWKDVHAARNPTLGGVARP